jgi:hypothetical protein
MHFWVGKLDGREPPAGGGPPQPYYDEGCLVLPATADTPASATCTSDYTLKNPDGSAQTNPDGSLKTVKVPYFFDPPETTKPWPAMAGDPDALPNGWINAKVDLSFYAPQRVIGGFGFSTNDEMNKFCPNGGTECPSTDKIGLPQVIYLDDIVWE